MNMAIKGRPSLYTDELAEMICEEIATSSKSMKVICEGFGLNVATVLTWISEGHKAYKESFSKMYARAKSMQADFLFDEILEIADDGRNDFTKSMLGDIEIEQFNSEHVQRSKLRVDARKWAASKLAPKKYGDKIDVTSDNKQLGLEPLKLIIVPPNDDDGE